MNQQRIVSPRTAVLSAFLLAFTAIAPTAVSARDDVMPAPKAAPRTPVEAQKLPGSIERAFEAASKPAYTAPAKAQKTAKKEPKSSVQAPAEANSPATGAAQAIDGASLKLGNTELQLGGLIVAPVTSPEGMFARTTLDRLIEGQNLNCVRRAAEAGGKLLVTCTRGDGNDIAAEMLRAGAALYSRTAALPEATITSYRVAEMEAQQAKRGLWNNVPSNTAAATPTIAADASPVKIAPTIGGLPAEAPTLVKENIPTTQTTPTAAPTPVNTVQNTPVIVKEVHMEAASNIGNFGMAAGLIGLMLMGLAFFDFLQRRRTRFDHDLELRQQRQIVAAALAGELAAARDVCESRLHSMATGGEARYPRLRSYVYQTHVDKIGMMGPYLARQIATIYGQMADYSGNKEDLPYRNSDVMNRNALTKSLERLCGYTDAALEGLSYVEMSGDVFIPAYAEDYDDEEPRQIPQQPRGGGRKIKLPTRTRALPKPEPKATKRPPVEKAEYQQPQAKAEQAEPVKLTGTETVEEMVSDYVAKATGVKPRSIRPGATRAGNPMAARAALEALEAINKEWPTDVEDVVEGSGKKAV